jgi:hypothetical protein
MTARGLRLLAAGWAWTTLGGCAAMWDEVTSREFSLKNYVSPPDPMTVLKTSKDGDARAKAYARLKEPARSGRSQAEQDEVVEMLSRAALSDPQPLCRMAAIRTLGTFQDPRAVTTLIAAYESADQLTPEPAAMVRCQTMRALGETRKPEAANFLVDIAKKPVKVDLADRERAQARDIRLAAVRSLKNFPEYGNVTSVAQILATQEKDVAVRDRAREAYVAMTGRQPTDVPEVRPDTGVPERPGSPVVTVGHSQSR